MNEEDNIDRETFFHDLKNPDSELSSELLKLQLSSVLCSLYLIYMTADDEEVVWGARSDKFSLSPERVMEKLLNFMKEYGVHDDSSREQVKVLYDSGAEVEYVLGRYMIPYVKGHGGSIALSAVNEASGEVRLLLNGICGHCDTPVIQHIESGIKHVLKHVLKRLLPWIKELQIVEQP